MAIIETSTREVTNRERAVRAALQIAGTQGIHALTHGRVDAIADLPKGSTSNYFRTRAALLHATVDHLASAERSTFAPDAQPQSIEELIEALTQFVNDAGESQRTLTVARFAFFMVGIHDPQVRSVLAEARAHINTWAARTLERLGIARPFAAADRILDHLDGAILHTLTFGNRSEIKDDIDAVVRSCTG